MTAFTSQQVLHASRRCCKAHASRLKVEQFALVNLCVCSG